MVFHLNLLFILTVTLGGQDYGPSTSSYNGIGRFLALAEKEKIEIIPISNLDWQKYSPKKTTLFFLSPVSPIPPKKLASFLHHGGIALIADDFREGIGIFEALGLSLHKEEQRFSKAYSVSSDSLEFIGVNKLQTNHAASFYFSRPPLFAFPGSGRALFGKLPTSPGLLYLLSDPSIFINDMINREDNKRFITILLHKLVVNNRKLFLITRFSEKGWPLGKTPHDNENLSTKDIIKGFILETVSFLKKNHLGLRIIAFLLMIPFIYVILLFFGTTTLWTGNPPVQYSSHNLDKKIIRFMALRDIFFEKLYSYTRMDPLIPENRASIVSQISKHKNIQFANRIKSLIIDLYGFTAHEKQNFTHISQNRLLKIINNIEECLKIMDSY